MFHRPPPPEGYASWLDYAVSTMDSRSVELRYLLADDEQKWTRYDMEVAVREELAELRKLASSSASLQR